MNGQTKNLIDIQRRKDALNKAMTNMTLQQFKQALIDMGYKQHECANNDLEVFKKRNNRVDIYCGGDYYNVYYEKQVKSGSIEYNQHRVTDFKKALANISKFERKLGI